MKDRLLMVLGVNALWLTMAILADSGVMFFLGLIFAVGSVIGIIYSLVSSSNERQMTQDLDDEKKLDKVEKNIEPPIRLAEHKQAPRSHPPLDRKYRPGPIHHRTPVPKHKGHHIDKLRTEHDKMSGEEVFKELRRHHVRHRIKQHQ